MKQGEIWLINLNPTVGAEIRKTRPAIIVNDDSLGKLPLRVIVPVTDWKDQFARAPWMIRIVPNTINGLKKPSSADCFQIRSISQERCIKKIGKVSDIILEEIKNGLVKVLTIEN